MSEHENASGRRMFSQRELEDTERALDPGHKPTGEWIDTGSQNVRGYKQQTQAHLALVNAVKGWEASTADFIRTYLDAGVKLDPRQVASARTHLEYAFYHLVRAVFQPADPIGDAVKEGDQPAVPNEWSEGGKRELARAAWNNPANQGLQR